MPKTDAEWQALDADIARKVMNYREELSYDMLVWAGTRNDGTKHWIAQYAWQPHKNVDQAMRVLDKMSRHCKGAMHNWFYRIQSYPQVSGHLYNVYLQKRVPREGSQTWCDLECSADADIREHAICLAVEKCLDIQKIADGR